MQLNTENNLNDIRRMRTVWVELTLESDDMKGHIRTGYNTNASNASTIDQAIDDLDSHVVEKLKNKQMARISEFDPTNTNTLFIDFRNRYDEHDDGTDLNKLLQIELKTDPNDADSDASIFEFMQEYNDPSLGTQLEELITNVKVLGWVPFKD